MGGERGVVDRIIRRPRRLGDPLSKLAAPGALDLSSNRRRMWMPRSPSWLSQGPVQAGEPSRTSRSYRQAGRGALPSAIAAPQVERDTDRVGFEPTNRLPGYTLSRRVPSATRPPVPRRSGRGTRFQVNQRSFVCDGPPGAVPSTYSRARRLLSSRLHEPLTPRVLPKKIKRPAACVSARVSLSLGYQPRPEGPRASTSAG